VNELGKTAKRTTEAEALATINAQLSELYSLIQRGSTESYFAGEALRLVEVIRGDISQITGEPKVPTEVPAWVDAIRDKVDKLDENLREMRRASGIGPSAV
jgi:hypothetical protein